jgi:hypothetical protein
MFWFLATDVTNFVPVGDADGGNLLLFLATLLRGDPSDNRAAHCAGRDNWNRGFGDNCVGQT